MITHYTDITLDLSTDGERAEVWAKQDDTGSRAVTATFVDNGTPVSLSSVDSAELRVLRPDGAMVTATAEISGNTVTAVFPETALEVGGEGYGDIRLLDGAGGCISAARFILHISPAAVSNDQAAASSDLTALLNSYMGGLHFKALTESEYAALDPKNPDTLYIVTADEEVGE